MSKSNCCSRANQWCNWHVQMLLHSIFTELQIYKGMVKCWFFYHFGHFWRKIRPLCLLNRTLNLWEYKTGAQELTSGAIRIFLSLSVKISEGFKDRAYEGLFCNMKCGGKLDIFTFFAVSQLCMNRFWKNW